jgi:hypothetical protein
MIGKKIHSYNLHLAPQEKSSDFQEAAMHLTTTEREKRLVRGKGDIASWCSYTY